MVKVVHHDLYHSLAVQVKDYISILICINRFVEKSLLFSFGRIALQLYLDDLVYGVLSACGHGK